MVLIGLLGKKRSGKDTSADHLVKNHGFIKMSFADPLKEAVGILFGFSDEQLYGNSKEEIDPTWGITPRLVFQWFGTEIFRTEISAILPNIKNNFWVEAFKVRYLNLIKNNPNMKIVVADVRFQNEIDIIHKLGGTIIKIDRVSVKSDDNHASENIDSLNEYNTLIENNGTIEELYKKLDEFININ